MSGVSNLNEWNERIDAPWVTGLVFLTISSTAKRYGPDQQASDLLAMTIQMRLTWKDGPGFVQAMSTCDGSSGEPCLFILCGHVGKNHANHLEM